MAKKQHIKPSTRTYNLLLRAVRDCGLGPPHLFQQLLPANATVLVSLNAPSKVQFSMHVPRYFPSRCFGFLYVFLLVSYMFFSQNIYFYKIFHILLNFIKYFVLPGN